MERDVFVLKGKEVGMGAIEGKSKIVVLEPKDYMIYQMLVKIEKAIRSLR